MLEDEATAFRGFNRTPLRHKHFGAAGKDAKGLSANCAN
jgi:hypothetical protein